VTKVGILGSKSLQPPHLVLPDNALTQHLVYVVVREWLHDEAAARQNLGAAPFNVSIK
jgi:hypothetical protein